MNIGYSPPTEEAFANNAAITATITHTPPPLPPTIEEEEENITTEPEPDDSELSGNKRHSIKFHRPSIIKALFPKEKDRQTPPTTPSNTTRTTITPPL